MRGPLTPPDGEGDVSPGVSVVGVGVGLGVGVTVAARSSAVVSTTPSASGMTSPSLLIRTGVVPTPHAERALCELLQERPEDTVEPRAHLIFGHRRVEQLRGQPLSDRENNPGRRLRVSARGQLPLVLCALHQTGE